MVETILSSPLVSQVILPFLLVFVLVFAILQRTKILGEGKKQIDALISLVIGLIVVSFGYATNIITSLVPFLAVAAVIILVFLLLAGMAFPSEEFKLHKGVKVTIGILAAVGVIIAVLVATGTWDYIAGLIQPGSGSTIGASVIFLVVIIAVAVLFMWPEGGEKKKKPE